jgi:polysaccharide export outer membrane protein
MKTEIYRTVLAFALLLAGLLSIANPAQAQSDMTQSDMTRPASNDARALPDGYLLGPGDTIQVSIPGQDNFNSQVQVQPDGTVQLPYIRVVRAEGLSPQALQNAIAAKLMEGGYFNNPIVNVVVTGYSNSYVTVLGQVNQPGLISLNRNYRLSEIIARAGGIGPNGSESVSLTRKSGEQLSFTVPQMATGGNATDPYVEAGDKVYVARVEEGERPVFYIYGQVNAPGSYPLVSGMSVRMALARGGGLTSLGSEGKVVLYREGKEVRNTRIDDVVKSGDVIKVGERFF